MSAPVSDEDREKGLAIICKTCGRPDGTQCSTGAGQICRAEGDIAGQALADAKAAEREKWCRAAIGIASAHLDEQTMTAGSDPHDPVARALRILKDHLIQAYCYHHEPSPTPEQGEKP